MSRSRRIASVTLLMQRRQTGRCGISASRKGKKFSRQGRRAQFGKIRRIR
jgi:hypothetical protein